RADAAPGGADLRARIGGRVLAEAVELPVERKDEGSVFGDLQVVRANRHALRRQTLDLGYEGVRIENHAIADNRQLAWADDAGRQQRELIAHPIDHQRVASI